MFRNRGYDGLRVQTTAADGTLTRWFTPSILEIANKRHHYIKLKRDSPHPG